MFDGAEDDELPYLLPFLAAIRPGDGTWLEPFTISSLKFARMGAAFALAFYPDLKNDLERLLQDKNGDVAEAARFTLAAHEHGKSGADDACWSLAITRVLFPRKTSYRDMIEAICSRKGLTETVALRHWRQLQVECTN